MAEFELVEGRLQQGATIYATSSSNMVSRWSRWRWRSGNGVAVGVGAYDAPPCVFRGWSYQGLRTSLPRRGENCGVSGSPPGNAHELGATVVATTACAL